MKKRKQLMNKKRREAMKRLFSSHTPAASPRAEVQQQAAPSAAQQPHVVGLPIYYSELMDRVPSEDEVDALVSSFAKRPTFFMLEPCTNIQVE